MKIDLLLLLLGWLGLTLSCGWVWQKFNRKWYPAELASAALAGGTLAWIWLLFIGSIFLPTDGAVWLVSLISVALFCAVFRMRLAWRSEAMKRRHAVVWAAYGALSAIAFYALLSHVTLYPFQGNWMSSGGSWGDLPMHSSLVTYLSEQARVSFTYPLLVKTRLVYPFLMDFLSSLLYRGGMSLRWSLLLPSWLLWWVSAQLIFAVTYRMFKSAGAGVMASLIFFLNGSFYGIFVAWSAWRQSGQSLWLFLGNLPTDYTQVPDKGLELINLTASHILPQRGIIFGLAGVLLAWLLILRRDDKETASWWWVPPAVITGLLPLVHLHSFLFMIAVFCAALIIPSKKTDRVVWGQALAVALILALPQITYQLEGQRTAAYQAGSFIKMNLGWLTPTGTNPLTFWWDNALPFLLLLVLAAAARRFWRDTFSRSLILSVLFLMVLLNLVTLQPNIFDNYKLFFYVWLAVAVLGAGRLAEMWHAGRWWVRLVVPLFILSLTLPGLLSLLSVNESSFTLFSGEDIEWASRVRSLTPADSLILTSGEHNNPVSALSGRRVVRGYPGWLWSYGWVTTPLDIDLSAIWEGSPQTGALLKKYGINYIAIRLPDSRRIPSFAEHPEPDPRVFDRFYPRIVTVDGWVLYDVPRD